MKTNLPLVLQIQSDAMDDSIPVTSLLRKTKAAAIKLGIEGELSWIAHELDGYNGVAFDDLPKYRQITGVLKVRNPFHGLQPLHFSDSEFARVASEAPARQSTAELESLLASDSKSLQAQMSSEKINALMELMKVPMEPVLSVSRESIVGILSSVRNLILDWSLEMEKAGVLGDDMTFGHEERASAQPVTQQFNIQNVGVLGNMNDQATAKNTQHASITLDLKAAQDAIDQLSAQTQALPEAIRDDVQKLINCAQEQLQADTPNRSAIHRSLQSIKSICEGVSGNLIATGVVSLLSSIIG